MAATEAEQLRQAAQFIHDGNWEQLNALFASSPKSTDIEAQNILSAQDAEQASDLLATWKKQVQAEAITRSNFGSIVK